VLGAVDRWLSGPSVHSSAQAVITQALRDAVPERSLQLAADVGQWCSGWATDVNGAMDRLESGLTRRKHAAPSKNLRRRLVCCSVRIVRFVRCSIGSVGVQLFRSGSRRQLRRELRSSGFFCRQ